MSQRTRARTPMPPRLAAMGPRSDGIAALSVGGMTKPRTVAGLRWLGLASTVTLALAAVRFVERWVRERESSTVAGADGHAGWRVGEFVAERFPLGVSLTEVSALTNPHRLPRARRT